MSIEKRIGKIKSVSFGWGGYQDAQLGITFDLGSNKESWGVGDFWGIWGNDPDKYAKWTTEEQVKIFGKMVKRIGKILSESNMTSIDKLIGKPIEVSFDQNMLKSWRILTEAI